MGYNLFWQIIVLINSAQLLYCAIEDEGIDVSHVKQMIAKNANYLESIILEPAIVYSISLFVLYCFAITLAPNLSSPTFIRF